MAGQHRPARPAVPLSLTARPHHLPHADHLSLRDRPRLPVPAGYVPPTQRGSADRRERAVSGWWLRKTAEEQGEKESAQGVAKKHAGHVPDNGSCKRMVIGMRLEDNQPRQRR